MYVQDWNLRRESNAVHNTWPNWLRASTVVRKLTGAFRRNDHTRLSRPLEASVCWEQLHSSYAIGAQLPSVHSDCTSRFEPAVSDLWPAFMIWVLCEIAYTLIRAVCALTQQVWMRFCIRCPSKQHRVLRQKRACRAGFHNQGYEMALQKLQDDVPSNTFLSPTCPTVEHFIASLTGNTF